jgi:hypothetical protein
LTIQSRGVFLRATAIIGDNMDAKASKRKPLPLPVVSVSRSNRRARAAARENPQAYPELSNKQLAADLEDNSLDEDAFPEVL